VIDKDLLNAAWDKLAGEFAPATLREVDVDGATFHVLFLPLRPELRPHAFLETGLSFYACPRVAAYRYRYVLVPEDSLTGSRRWEIRLQDIVDWLMWAEHMGHIVTFSTLKSGASRPLTIHGQSFPLTNDDGVPHTALADAAGDIIVDFGQMPHFGEIRIESMMNYPVRGLRISCQNTPSGRLQAAEKTYELALSYDALKAFNLVILPSDGRAPCIHFFPRRRDGRAAYGPSRWQIAAIEVNGLMQVKNAAAADKLDARTIKDIFQETTLDSGEFADFARLIDAF